MPDELIDNKTPQWMRTTEPGILVLSGTEFCIIYRPHPDGAFLLLQSGCHVNRFARLDDAKREAQSRQRELEEIGVA